MKKFVIIIGCFLICSCTNLQQYNSSVTTEMKSCLITEANSRLQAGTLFTNSVKTTASEIVSSCTKQLALQSTGIDNQTQNMAENIISGLKAVSTTK